VYDNHQAFDDWMVQSYGRSAQQTWVLSDVFWSWPDFSFGRKSSLMIRLLGMADAHGSLPGLPGEDLLSLCFDWNTYGSTSGSSERPARKT
jgi:hypothetical protein